MKRSSKGGVKKLSEPYEVRFELEPDAESIFESYLENDTFEIKEIDGDGKRSFPKARKSAGECRWSEIDLHGFTAQAAKEALDSVIKEWRASQFHELKLKIITGKGLHSADGKAVLSVEVFRHVTKRYRGLIHKVDEAPHKVVVGGVPIRGHFNVHFRKK